MGTHYDNSRIKFKPLWLLFVEYLKPMNIFGSKRLLKSYVSLTVITILKVLKMCNKLTLKKIVFISCKAFVFVLKLFAMLALFFFTHLMFLVEIFTARILSSVSF